jgi:hypothetical protein
MFIIRTILLVLGIGFFLKITGELFQGHITYTVGEVVEETVTTNTMGETLAVWVAFGSLFVAMIIGGAAPELYVEKPWLWKALVSLIFCGYVVSSILQ